MHSAPGLSATRSRIQRHTGASERGGGQVLHAARHGLDASFYDLSRRENVPAREAARSLVQELRPVAQDLGCETELLDVLEIVDGGTGSQLQRRVYEQNEDLLDVVAYLIEGTRPALAGASD